MLGHTKTLLILAIGWLQHDANPNVVLQRQFVGAALALVGLIAYQVAPAAKSSTSVAPVRSDSTSAIDEFAEGTRACAGAAPPGLPDTAGAFGDTCDDKQQPAAAQSSQMSDGGTGSRAACTSTGPMPDSKP